LKHQLNSLVDVLTQSLLSLNLYTVAVELMDVKNRLLTYIMVLFLLISPLVGIAEAQADVPLVGALVFASGGNGFSYATTDSSGHYIITEGLGVGNYNVTVSAEGYLHKEVPASVVIGQETKNVNLRLSRSGGISGKVTDSSSGQGLKGVMIAASSKSGFGWFAITDDAGNYRIITNLGTDTYNVTVTYAVGYTLKDLTGVSVTVGVETKNQNIALVKSGIISGKITSTTGSLPLKGITVMASSSDGKGFMGTAETDSSGNYKIDSGLGTGTYTVTAYSGMSFNELENVNVVAGQETPNINMTLAITPPEPSGTIRGKVTDSNNIAVASAHVSASGENGSGSDTTDSEGMYEISDGLGTGTYNVTVTKEGYIDNEKTGVSVTVGSVTADVNIQIQSLPPAQSGSISGTVTGEANPLTSKNPSTITCSVDKSALNVGESVIVSGAITPAVSGATVSLTFNMGSTSIPKTATTGADGKYSTSYTPTDAGSWSVSAIWVGNTNYNGAASQSAVFTVNAAPTTGDLKVTVKNSSGAAISGATVTSTSTPSGQSALSGTSASDGSVSFTGVKAGSYTFQASKTGMVTGSASGSVIVGSSTNAINISLAPVAPTTGDLKVTVKDSSGAAISGATVTSTSTPSGQSALSGTSASDGTVTFNSVVPGSFTIQAAKSGYTSATGTGSVTAGATGNISITLQTQSTGGGGIPGFPIEATIMGIAIVAMLWILQRKRLNPSIF